MLRTRLVFTLALLMTLALAAPFLNSQSLYTGDVAGTVTDPTGAVVPGASVTLRNNDTGATVTRTTNSAGVYRFSLLQPGAYTLSFSGPGMQATQRTVRVTTGQGTTLNVQMALAAEQQTVTVTAESAIIQTEHPDISTTFSSEQVALQPNPGNDLTFVAQTAPGAIMNTQSGLGNFSTFGLPSTSNNFTFNGMAENDPFLNLNNSGATNILLGLNDVQETTVTNNGYQGQYGGLAGAQVNYVSKSGSNTFHGNAIYQWNGRIMNANNFFNKREDPKQPRPFVNANQFGASFGGPIKKDKNFFFVNGEGLWVIVPNVRLVNVPSQQFQTATLNNLAATNPGSVPFYRNMFNLWNNAPGAAGARNVLADGGCGSFAGTAGFGAGNPCALQFTSTVSAKTNEWLITGRYDHNLGENDRLFVHFRTDHGTQASYIDPINSAFNIISDQPQYEGQANWTHSFSSNTTNSFLLAGSYYSAIFDQSDPEAAARLMPQQVSFLGGSQRGLFYSLGAAYQFPFGTPQGRNLSQYQIIDDITHTRGNHSFKFGVNFIRYNITSYGPQNGSRPAVFGETLEDFISGAASNLQQNFPQRLTQPFALYNLGLYAQDEWRVTPNLKLTFALRADRNSNTACRTNCFSRLAAPFESISHDPNQPYNAVIRTGLEEALPEIDGINWGPRFGFTWSPFGAATSTVLRGGFGLFYDRLPAFFAENLMNNAPGNPQFIVSSAVSPVPLSPDVAGNAISIASTANNVFQQQFAAGGTFASISNAVAATGAEFFAPSFFNTINRPHNPRIQQWNLELQQGIGTKTSLSFNYVGNHGIFQGVQNAGINAYCDATCLSELGATGTRYSSLPTAVPDERFGTVTQMYSSGVSNYHGLTVSMRRRLSSLQAQINYTWSHALDVLSNNGIPNTPFNFGTNTSIGFPQDPADFRRFNYGNADYDVRHYLSLSWVYNAPQRFGPHGILGGWVFSGNAFARTGMPFTVTDAGAGSVLTGFNYGNTVFAEQLGGGAFTCGQSAVDTTCPEMASNFSPATNGFGNQRRNQVYGPRFFNLDLSLLKNFKIPGWEGAGIAVGARAFNLLNRTNFDQPFQDIAGSDFGRISSAVAPPTSIYGSGLGGDASPRNVQLTARFTF